MIVIAIIIVLIILVMANVALTAFNKFYPPCPTSRDVFEEAKRISSEKISSLSNSNIQPREKRTHNADTIEDDYNEENITHNQVLNARDNTTEGMNTVMNGNLNDREYNETFKDALKGAVEYKTSQEETKKTTSEFDGSNLAIFETEMEGIQANVGFVNAYGARAPPSKFVRAIDRDGYSDRMQDAY